MDRKRIIGVCITKIHDTTRADLMHRLHHLAMKNNYKLLIFNSFIDFYNNDAFDKGAASVYDIINFDLIDALIIHTESFCNKSLIDKIIVNAKEHNTSVILLDRTCDGCFSIVGDYEAAFKTVINHIIKEHSVKDLFFIGGKKENDPFTESRIRCYKEVLLENGVDFNENNIGYGEYWSGPTKETVYNLISDGKKPPEAIVCANDYMAFAACEELTNNGYRVPEDVIVTGYDGVPASEHFGPKLTTCVENLEKLAEVCIEAVDMAVRGEKPCTLKNTFEPRISESCGCNQLTNENFRDTASELYVTLDQIQIHEDFMYACINHMLNIRDIHDLHSSLSEAILENSYICLNSDFIASIINNNKNKNRPSDELIVIPSKYSYHEAGKESKITLTELLPNYNDWLDDKNSYILSAVYVGDYVCGYYAFKTDNIIGASHKIKRVLNTVNIAFTVAMNYFKQLSMKLSVQRAVVINPLTDLPNLKGTATWFEEFASPENRSKTMTISVYALPKYTYILENYGISDAEKAVQLTANALKLANSGSCFIGHIAEDQFVVINQYDNPEDIHDVINSATSAFFSVIESYNSESGKKYYVEVNCGCTVVNPGWNGSLESFIKFANGEMYMNRLKLGMGSVIREESDPKTHYKAFELLIEKNLFKYHFQPIVNAKNGEIIAYEALMRTDSAINMRPLEILEAAKEYNRLYDIEKATMFNVMEHYSRNKDKFGDKKVFINSIPGHFLSDEDMDILFDRYKEHMDNFIFELTEQDSVPDEELYKIKKLSGNADINPIAIDDYGMGHSNIVNLMRYSPHIIKIDHFLISDIHKNQNKQHFVRSTIEFAKLNNIMVLAEGVETSNEMHTLIDLGVDYIQGFYTGRPAPEPVPSINEEIRQEIIQANPLY